LDAQEVEIIRYALNFFSISSFSLSTYPQAWVYQKEKCIMSFTRIHDGFFNVTALSEDIENVAEH
jgi:hypothetical protein